jgi:ribosomal protein S20
LHPESADEAAAELSALAEAPFGPHDPSGLAPSGVTLNIAAASALLSAPPHPGEDMVAEAQGRLWALALALDGALPDAAARALAEARARLRDAMEDRANGQLSQKDLNQRLEELRQALDKRLAEIGKQAVQRGAIDKFDPDRQHLSSSALDKLIRKMEQAAREGRMDDAKQAMAELEKMLDQLKNAHIMTKEETQQRQEQARRGRQIMGAVQDLVRRETGLLDHAQLRAPATPPGLPPQFRGFPFPPAGGTDETPDDPASGSEPTAPPDQTPDQPPPDQAQSGNPPPLSPRQQQTADARTQRALHRALGALSQGFAESGGQPPRSLEESGHAMDDAAQALDSHQDPQARDAISRAIAALQQGGQSMSHQMSAGASGQMQLSLQPGGQSGDDGSGQDGEDGPDDGHGGRKKDPFGRQVDGNGTTADDPSLRVPDQMEQGRSRAIQEELRRRGADRQRPQGELDYIDRLLKPF